MPPSPVPPPPVPIEWDGSKPDDRSYMPDAAFMANFEAQLAKLQEGITKLSARAEADLNAGKPSKLFLSNPETSKKLRTELSELPTGTTTVFCEFDELCLQGDAEATLLGCSIEGRDDRVAAWQSLKMPIEEAVAKLEAADVRLDPSFVEFIERCSVRRLRVCILSRGLKPLVRALLREQGIGHVEVLAHDMYVDRQTSEWKVAFRDDSETGHDKAESVRRALRNHEKAAVVLVGRTVCDYAPILAGSVDCVIAQRPSELARLCDEAGVRTRDFKGWDDLTASTLLSDHKGASGVIV